MRPLRITLLAALVAIGVATAASAEVKEFMIDRSHTEVGFSIRHYFTKVRGEFTDFSGVIRYDAENVANSTVEVTVKDTSIFTGNENRDKHLRTEDFFWVEKHPTITFKSTKVTPGADKSKFQVAGDLTIRGVTKPVVLDAEMLGMGAVTVSGRDMGTRVGFNGTTTINRKDFGINWNRTLDQGGVMLGDDVELVLEVEAFTKPTPTAATTTEKAPAAGGDKKK